MSDSNFADLGQILVIIPTFNELESLPIIIGRVRQSVPEAHILVADDNSPDGTGVLADSLAQDDTHVQVMHRLGKEGLGAAYLAGFAWALQQGYDVVVEMDADGSHRVADLPAMLDATDHKLSITLGTRWMPGGSVVNWPKSRQLLSKSGTKYARIALGIPLNDLTGGFRVYSADLLNSLKLTQMTATGYCFQIEMAMAATLAGAKLVEVPITFVERINGVSKMSRAIVIEALWQTTLWGLSRRLRPNADKLHYVK